MSSPLPGEPRRVWRRYALLQVPSLGLLILGLFLVQQWIDLSGGAVAGIIALWLAKDVALFPLVWRSYAVPDPARHPLVGARAVAVGPLAPGGTVRVGGEVWKAELVPGADPVEAGAPVEVRGGKGLLLFVARPGVRSADPSAERSPVRIRS